MPLQSCMGIECGEPVPQARARDPVESRSAWSHRISKDKPVDETDTFSAPLDLPQQLLSLLKEQQLAVSQLLAGQRGLLLAMEQQHRDLCEQFSRLNSLNTDSNSTKPFDVLSKMGDQAAAKINMMNMPSTAKPSYSREKKRIVMANQGNRPKDKRKKLSKAWGRSATTLTPITDDSSCWTSVRWRLARRLDHPYFDLLMGLFIVANFAVDFISLQVKGMNNAKRVGLPNTQSWFGESDSVFHMFEVSFCAVYFTELLARVVLLRRRTLCTVGSIVDACTVLVSCVDAWILTPFVTDPDGDTFAMTRFVRLVRISRILRAVKVFRFMSMFRELRVMLLSFFCSVAALLWSMLLVSFLVVAGGVLMVQLTHSAIVDETLDLELRQWIYLQFGTATRSTWSIFESTFTATWPAKARRLVFEVHPLFSLFWVTYVVVVNFAIMRVIAALFLKHTLSVSNQESERMSMEKMQEKEAFASKLREIFQRGDQLGDGVLHQWEFEAMMQDKDILVAFEHLDLSLHEILTLYNVLSSRDGVCDYEEFLAGALKMKNTSRTLDIIEVQHEQMILRRITEELSLDCHRFFQACFGIVDPDLSSASPRPHDHHDHLASARTEVGGESD